MTAAIETSQLSENASRVFARGKDEGTARWWMGSLALIKATSAETGGLYTLVEVREDESETPLHVHHREDETFWVLEGEVEFEVGGTITHAGPGTMLFGPRGVPHRYAIRRGPARLLFLFTPGGFEGLLMETSEPAGEFRLPLEGEAMPDFETLPATVRKYGCELLA
ncbi:cupin domain-containing protein [Nitratireductor mangrovi]|uniref:Cupin domain-containing protein n=1 Tax=Nitratireductor mangrovi TaxID=2599600 RepID=A0A5B8KY52_9HYPH|nr:cupin domain-containing protein [Nitratireductor mangrovi]QDZ00499.2 cupin domain-containing protein [Nitratireductor mangrovi]